MSLATLPGVVPAPIGTRGAASIGPSGALLFYFGEAQVNVNVSSPNFSIDVESRSPGLSQTCFSLGYPEITPSGVPVKMMSPGLPYAMKTPS